MIFSLLESLTALGPRLAGTEAARRGAELVAESLAAVGATVSLQRFTYDGWTYGEAPSVTMVAPKLMTLATAPMPFAPASHGAIEGPVRILDEPVVMAGLEFSRSLIVTGGSEEAHLVVAATDMPFPLPASDMSVVSALIGRQDGEEICRLLESGVQVRMEVETFGGSMASEDANVVGVLDGDESRTIAVTSHYDTAWRSPGASDNAAGVAIMVELARRMRSSGVDNRFEFISFAAEELGLCGSRRFVESAVAGGRLNQYLAVLNLDPGLGSTPSLRCEVGPDWIEREAAAVAASQSLPFVSVDPGGAVDSTPFWEAGVAVCCPQFLPSPPWFHLPDDLPENLIWSQLEAVLEFSDALLRRLALQPSRA